MTANFIDAGAAEFLRSELDKEKPESSTLKKRRRYTVDKAQVNKADFLTFILFRHSI